LSPVSPAGHQWLAVSALLIALTIVSAVLTLPASVTCEREDRVLNRLFYGDNLEVLREHIKDESVDLIYLDPPFNSKRDYNLLFRSPKGHQSDAQITAFEDTWHWGEQAEREYAEVLRQKNTNAAELLCSFRRFLGENDMMAYLTMMANRLLELHRVLKTTGSLYLHCDPTASHYLRLLLDSVFGPVRFGSEIIWKRSSAHSDAKQGRRNYGHIHDLLLFYAKSEKYTWNPIHVPYSDSYVGRDYRLLDEVTGRYFRRGDLTAARPGGDTEYDWRVKKRAGVRERWVADLQDEHLSPKPGWEYRAVRPYKGRYWAYSKGNMRQFASEGRLRHTFEGMPEYKRFLDEMPGVLLQDIWTDILPIVAGTEERLGYPTQKPVALLERIVSASSNEGQLILDPFCGCGTAVHAAEKLKRAWIGIDITHLAIALIEKRLKDAFPDVTYEVHGTPKDIDGARDLAARDKYQFQWWACSLVNAQPYQGKKKGADSGIDGLIYFQDQKGFAKKIIVSVKGGEHVGRVMVADLKNSVEREKAEIGLFVTLTPPTHPMITEAASAGFYESPSFLGQQFPRIQILTVEGLLKGTERPRYPDLSLGLLNFRRSRKEGKEQQGQLPLVADKREGYGGN
jgi:DNA modification methylase